MQEYALLFYGKIYTAGTNFTRPSVAPVVTNLNSAETDRPNMEGARYNDNYEKKKLLYSVSPKKFRRH